ncbi:MAG TPA: rhomboid family intramembrane serine protease [Actinomycetota bacterium]
MIPIRDANPATRRPYVTWAFIALNVALFLLWQPRGSCPSDLRFTTQAEEEACALELAFTFCHGAIPEELTSFRPMTELPATTQAARSAAQLQELRCPEKGVLGSLFSSMFMHGGLLHLGGNMLYLWIFGNNVEDRMGHLVFPIFYLAGGVVATYAHVATAPSSAIPLVGASGAIAAVLGAYLVMWPHARVTTLVIFFFITVVELPAVVVLGLWFLLQAFQGVGSLGVDVGGVAWWAHIGGFAFGAVVAWLFFRGRREPEVIRPTFEY